MSLSLIRSSFILYSIQCTETKAYTHSHRHIINELASVKYKKVFSEKFGVVCNILNEFSIDLAMSSSAPNPRCVPVGPVAPKKREKGTDRSLLECTIN